MNDKLLQDFLIFLQSEGLITKPLSARDVIDKFYTSNRATATIKAPKGYEGFATGEKKKSSTGN